MIRILGMSAAVDTRRASEAMSWKSAHCEDANDGETEAGEADSEKKEKRIERGTCRTEFACHFTAHLGRHT